MTVIKLLDVWGAYLLPLPRAWLAKLSTRHEAAARPQ